MSPLLVRRLAAAHVALLILFRIVTDRDDVNNWDLIPFLNAQGGPLPALLSWPEVHLRNPFAVPLYIIGSESVLGALFLSLFGRLSLYWASPLFAVLCVALFLFVIGRFFGRIAPAAETRAWAWLALSMSPVFLTFASTSAFNVQGYLVLVLGLVAVEEFVAERRARGTLVLALAFLLIAQAYALSLFLPYYVLAWALLRACLLRRPRVLWVLAPTLALALAVHWASGGAYLLKVAPWNPHETGNVLAGGSALVHRILFFGQEAFWPTPSPGVYARAFAPVFLLAVIAWAVVRAWPLGRTRREAGAILAGLVVLAFAYAPSFLSPVVKSHRAVPADLLLAALATLALSALAEAGRLARREVMAALVLGAVLSDARYLHAVLAVDHARNHYPVFDLDPADSLVRHDLQQAILAMRYQAQTLGAALVIVYPRVPRNENTTDPALFHARFLRYFGAYANGSDVAFPCHFCDPRYGCPFPDVLGEGCASTCCFRSPAEAWQRWRDDGRRVFLWSWAPAAEDVWTISRESVLPRTMAEPVPVLLPAALRQWQCEELRPPVLPTPTTPAPAGAPKRPRPAEGGSSRWDHPPGPRPPIHPSAD